VAKATPGVLTCARLVMVIAVTLSLASCGVVDPDQPAPSPSASDVGESDGSDSTQALPAPAVSAVVVVADVDVDGLNVTVSSYVAGLIELGGTCRYTWTNGSGEVTAEADGDPDRGSTTCGSTQVPIDQFERGSWMVIMTYEALDGGIYLSEPVPMEVP
jgi:hypothetical protein